MTPRETTGQHSWDRPEAMGCCSVVPVRSPGQQGLAGGTAVERGRLPSPSGRGDGPASPRAGRAESHGSLTVTLALPAGGNQRDFRHRLRVRHPRPARHLLTADPGAGTPTPSSGLPGCQQR